MVVEQSYDVTSVVLSIGIPLVVFLVMLLVVVVAGTELWARVRAAASKSRKYVDEKDDRVNVVLEKALDVLADALKKDVIADLDAEMISRILTALVDRISTTPAVDPVVVINQIKEATK